MLCTLPSVLGICEPGFRPFSCPSQGVSPSYIDTLTPCHCGSILPSCCLSCTGSARAVPLLLPAHHAVPASPNPLCWSPDLFWFMFQLRIKLQIFLCSDRISTASLALMRSQAFEVPHYLISLLQISVTHHSHPKSEPAWEATAEAQPLQPCCRAESSE